MNRRTFAVLAATILASTLSLTGCGREESRTGRPAPQVVEKTFAMNVLVSGVPFWNDTKAVWTSAGEKNGVNTVFGGPLDTDGQKQIQELDALIARKVDGLIIYPTDSAALIPQINKAVEAGIPVITYLNDAPGSKRLTYITSELEEASIRVAQTTLPPSEKPVEAIIMYAQAGNEEQEARRRGFERLAQQTPNVKIVATIEDKFDEAVGAEQLRPLLAKFPNVTHIFGTNSRSAVGAATVLRELRYTPGQISVTGWDADADVLALIDQGWVKASVYQNSAFMTQIAFNILKARAGGWLYPANREFEQNGVSVVPDKIVVPVQIITKENVRGYASVQ